MNITKTKNFIINHFGLPLDSNIILYRGYRDCKGIFIEDANPTHLKYIWGIRKNKVAHHKGNKYVRVGKVILPMLYIDLHNIYPLFQEYYFAIVHMIYFYDVILITANFCYIFFVAIVIFFIGVKIYDS